jgi:hypothetical protein
MIRMSIATPQTPQKGAAEIDVTAEMALRPAAAIPN